MPYTSRVEIQIIAPAGTGASTIAFLVAEALRADGFSVSRTDPSAVDGFMTRAKALAALPDLRDHVQIDIEVIQSPREGISHAGQ